MEIISSMCDAVQSFRFPGGMFAATESEHEPLVEAESLRTDEMLATIQTLTVGAYANAFTNSLF